MISKLVRFKRALEPHLARVLLMDLIRHKLQTLFQAAHGAEEQARVALDRVYVGSSLQRVVNFAKCLVWRQQRLVRISVARNWCQFDLLFLPLHSPKIRLRQLHFP